MEGDMSVRQLALAVVLLLVTLVAGVSVGAQVARAPVPVPPTVLAGPDVGFRVEGVDGEFPIGKLVVKVRGQWVEAQIRDGRLVQPAR
jgi:hypothetical protein